MDFQNQTWDMFAEEIKTKDVILFGVGVLASLYFIRFPRLPIAMAADNDGMKQGDCLASHVFVRLSDENAKKQIASFSDLRETYTGREVVLIASKLHYEEIGAQLEQAGILNCYSLKAMEEKQPTVIPGEGATTKEKLLDAYANDCCLHEIEEKKIVFWDMGSYAGHGKRITEQLLKARDDLDIVWILDDTASRVPMGVRIVSASEILQYTFEMETAYCWLIGNMIPGHVKKRTGQIYIHMKHWASVTLKTFGFDFYEFRKIPASIKMTEHDSQAMDYIITGSSFDEETCRRGFRFMGPVIRAGSPRSDVLFEEDKHKAIVYERYKIDRSKKVLLYAPTFRGGTGSRYIWQQYDSGLDFSRLVKALQQKYAGEWVILLRLHPLIAKQGQGMAKEDFVVDASGYDDSQELVAACDIMVTDYSSIMFEPAFVHKPVFLFAPDRDEYINHERRLLIDYDKLPFDIAGSNEELCMRIMDFDKQEYDQRLDAFFTYYGVHEDGHAGERAADFVLGLISNRQRDLISVIVPIYNTAQYLPRCIESILQQTYRKLEIILVNDGSTDQSGGICSAYAARDSRIRVINQENKGNTAARKAGLAQSTGTYVMFVDSDDWIGGELTEALYRKAAVYQLDMVVSDVQMVLENGSVMERKNLIKPGVYGCPKEAVRNLFYYGETSEYGILPYAIAKLYGRDLVRGALASIPDEIQYDEDRALVWTCLMQDIRVAFTEEMLYYYCIRADGLVWSRDELYLAKVSYFFQYMRRLFEKEGPALKVQLDYYIVHCVKDAVNRKLGLFQGNLFRERYELDASVFWEGSKEIVLYGAGRVGRDYCRQLSRYRNLHICAWVDRDAARCRNEGLDVQPAERIWQLDYDYILVAVKKEAVFLEIKETLTSKGIVESKILWGRPCADPKG